MDNDIIIVEFISEKKEKEIEEIRERKKSVLVGVFLVVSDKIFKISRFKW